MREGTGLSLSIGAQLLARKKLTKTGGVFAPEACIEPRAFVQDLDRKGMRGYRDLGLTRPFLVA
jgi:saccharopine dehydrogenase-like NADP-dependent oxidoreductase